MQPTPRLPVVVVSIAATATGIWIVTTTAILQALGWFVTELLLELSRPDLGWGWLGLGLMSAGAVAIPAGLLLIIARTLAPEASGVRAAGQAWLLAGAAGGVICVVRAVPLAHNEVRLGLTALAAVALAVLVRRRGAQPSAGASGGPDVPDASRRGWLAAAAGTVVLLPWLWIGALGGVSETLVAVAAAAGVGYLASALLDARFFAAYGRSRTWQVLVGGLSAGVALVPLAGAIGGAGVNLAELAVLPGLGFALAALGGRSAVLVGLAAAGPLALVDPEETSALLGGDDIGRWVAIAAAVSVPVVLAASAGLALLAPRRWPPRPVAMAAAMAVAVAAVGVYAGAGQPGFHGERLFVIMREQADLTGLPDIADRPARLRQTYQRLVAHADRTQAGLRQELDRLHLGYQPYYLVNGIMVDGGPPVRALLSRRADVDRVLLDPRLRPLPAPAPTTRGQAAPPGGQPQWNIEMVRADRVWDELGITGAGIVIGTSDSGVAGEHPALRDGFRGGEDSWYDPWNHTLRPTDHNGHGTHTLGSALGRGGIGVAPGAQWVGCVNLDRNLASPSRYLDCLQFMLAPFPAGGDPLRDGRAERAPHVLTNSWACPDLEGCDPDSLTPALAALTAAGIFFVAAAGNSGPECGTISDPPAIYPQSLTVGAVDRDRQLADFSSRGPTPSHLAKPDVVAPGVDVLSALPGDSYGELSGTSMATPHVAGVVALMWSANPALVGDIDTTRRLLRDSAVLGRVSVEACGGNESYGAGLVEAYQAVSAARKLDAAGTAAGAPAAAVAGAAAGTPNRLAGHATLWG